MLRRTLFTAPFATPLVAPLVAPLGLAAPALAQSAWPTRPVRVVIPWPPAGATDVLVRIFAERFQNALGQTFVVENRPGAGGNIGVDAVAKAAPDGYTLGIASVGHFSINQFLYKAMPWDIDRDFVPISLAWELPNVAVVSANHNPAKTLGAFLTWAKAQPKGVSYGSPGVGTSPHLSGALLAARAGYEGVHVPFRGAAQTIPAMLSGDLDFAIDNLASYVPVIQEGRMRALAVTSAARFPSMPDVPTMAEAGIADFVVTSWQGFVFAKGAPPAAIARLNAVMRELAVDPAMQERFLKAGATIAWSTPEALAERGRAERPMWQEAVRISAARLE